MERNPQHHAASTPMSSSKQDRLRNLPAVETLLQDPRIQALAERAPHVVLADAVRHAVDAVRQEILADHADNAENAVEPDKDALGEIVLDRALHLIDEANRPHCRKVINASGIILHTALGRAVLPQAVLDHFVSDLSGYSLLQMDLDTGRRGRRDPRIERLLGRLTGAEAATVVNNNAAATSLVLSTIARGKEVIVSRGQLVEIGGSFRLPDVMAASGAKLVEVGTTNKTHPRDYENAITENTAAIMRVHPSNYQIVGFTSETPLETLVEIAHRRNLLVYDDLGAGALIDFSRFGFQREPTLADSIRAGADLVSCSADKLIGSGQGGIILGRKDCLEAVRKNPIARMVRADKLTLAALEITLSLFLDEDRAMREVPTLRMLSRRPAEIAEQADRIAQSIRRRLESDGSSRDALVDVSVIDGCSQMGSGSLPTQNLPTRLVALSPRSASLSADEIARRLRQQSTPIVGRVQSDQVLLDPRTLLDGDEEILVAGVVEVCGGR